ncbi:MAG: type I-C CRISPR-associated protein Cas8c/Csd1 [Candidatus Gastranaerophilales bacterium]|nr:type I-C CRISPR-associated protein Cas8c/Csd1 [Candidatus Gastranaerophilales bacterium]
MILQALVKHYEDLLEKGEIPRPGWGTARVSFGMNLDKEGNIIDLVSLKVQKEKGKKVVDEPREMIVPQSVKRSVNISPNFLCDNATYILGVDEKGNPERTGQCFNAFCELHRELLQEVQSDAAKAVLFFLQKWDPEGASEHPCIKEAWKELMAGANILFCYEGKPVTEDTAVRNCWQQYYDNRGAEPNGFCMIIGKPAHIATLHPVIKGVYGAQAMGTSLVSFNAQAFCSYGKEQGENASVGEYAAAAYGAALNSLLSDREHSKWIGDTTIVCWADGGEKEYQDVGIAAMFGVEDEGKVTDENLSAILNVALEGKPIELENLRLDENRHFYILGVAPNAARLSVRFFWQDSFGNMLRNVGRHYDRLEIVKPVYDRYKRLPCWELLQETVNQNARDKTPSPQMAADMMKAILTGGAYPASLLNGVMLRIRAEHEVTRGRAAIIKAYYLKNRNIQCPEEVLQMALNEESGNVPYNLGRLFAVLEHIQQEANPGINSTIKDKYFNSAASAPANTFPMLINLAQKHLRKLRTEGSRISFQKQVQEIVDKLGEEYPVRMTMPQQGSFHLGYYHQTQKRYQKMEEK